MILSNLFKKKPLAAADAFRISKRVIEANNTVEAILDSEKRREKTVNYILSSLLRSIKNAAQEGNTEIYTFQSDWMMYEYVDGQTVLDVRNKLQKLGYRVKLHDLSGGLSSSGMGTYLIISWDR